MRDISKLALWLLLSATVIGTGVLPVSAQFYHPQGLVMSTYPQTILVFWTTQPVSQQLVVFIRPPWYFVSDVTSFQTVTLTATLTPTGLVNDSTDYLATPSVPMQLLGGTNAGGGSTVTFQWTNVVMSQDGYGGIVGGYLLCTITFVINPTSTTGFYRLYLTGQAIASDLTYAGWTQIGVSLRPPGYGPLFGNSGGGE